MEKPLLFHIPHDNSANETGILRLIYDKDDDCLKEVQIYMIEMTKAPRSLQKLPTECG